MAQDPRLYRDELIISTKAGYGMWPGPYGEWGSRKYLIASLDQSLKRMGLDYVDIFYSHRPDPDTPLEETMGALDFTVRSGRALYVEISNYNPEQTRRAAQILRDLGIWLSTSPLQHVPAAGRWLARRTRGDRDRRDLFFSTGPGIADEPLPDAIPEDSGGKPRFSAARAYHG